MSCNLREAINEGRVTFGTWVTIASTDVPDMLEEAGFDWLVFDTEHAPLTQQSVSSMIQAVDETRVCPVVRVGAVDMYFAKSYLDMGAHGILFPLVNTPAEARNAVSYCKYPPVGIRGVAPRKASSYGKRLSDYIRNANRSTVVAVQIETKEALDNLESIASVKGVDILFVGPTDLTMSLGLFEDRNNPKVIESMKKVVRACEKEGKVAGTLALDENEARLDLRLGFKFLGLSSDFRFLLKGASSILEKVKKL